MPQQYWIQPQGGSIVSQMSVEPKNRIMQSVVAAETEAATKPQQKWRRCLIGWEWIIFNRKNLIVSLNVPSFGTQGKHGESYAAPMFRVIFHNARSCSQESVCICWGEETKREGKTINGGRAALHVKGKKQYSVRKQKCTKKRNGGRDKRKGTMHRDIREMRGYDSAPL